MRNGKTLMHRICVPVALAVAMSCSAGYAPAAEKSTAGTTRAVDVIHIDAAAQFRALENSKVAFRHDMHTRTLASQGKDCSACHMSKDGKMSTKFMRLEDKSADRLKTLYHTNCVSCHVAVGKGDKAGRKTGPMESECKRCHDVDGRYASSRQAFAYEAVMHDKHVRSPLAKAGDSARNCALCHHTAAPGKEDSCRVCHAEGHGVRPWYSEVGHNFCITCHKDVNASAKAAPLECEGCHSGAAKTASAGKQKIPRLMRGQPDVTLMFPVSKNPATAVAAMYPTVFDHKTHEGKVPGCRSCHHVRIGTCTSCHTAEGSPAAYNVNLDKAMHSENAKNSCVGCHNKQIKAPECAGCHGFVKPEHGTASCKPCHSGSAALSGQSFVTGVSGAMPTADKTRLAQRAKASQTSVSPTSDGMPEEVTLGGLKDQYEANKFNHKDHMELLMGTVDDNKLASAFHTDPYTLCAGCHHNSPPSKNPPKCSSCHGKTPNPRFPERPTLKAAYHLLCMGCHDRMLVTPAEKTDCTACHEQVKK